MPFFGVPERFFAGELIDLVSDEPKADVKILILSKTETCSVTDIRYRMGLSDFVDLR
jgi:hypothetical protein